MAWTPRALLPGDMPCASPGLPTTCWSVRKCLRPVSFSAPGLSPANGSQARPRFLASLRNAARAAGFPFPQVELSSRRWGSDERSSCRSFSLNEKQESGHPHTPTSPRAPTAALLTARRNSSARLRCAPATPVCVASGSASSHANGRALYAHLRRGRAPLIPNLGVVAAPPHLRLDGSTLQEERSQSTAQTPP